MGRVKSDGQGGYYWDANDSGVDQSGGTWSPGPVGVQPGPSDQPPRSSPGPVERAPGPSGPFAGEPGGYAGPDGGGSAAPTNPWGAGARPSKGRIKIGPSGAYWDANDSGYDQAPWWDQTPKYPTTQATSGGTPAGGGGSTPSGLPSFGQVNDLYQRFLGRQASPSEFQTYWSGRPDYWSAIPASGEAAAYRQANPSQFTQPYDLQYWTLRGVDPTQIYDPQTGQLRYGWQRTANGYERTIGGPIPPGTYDRNTVPEGFDITKWQDPTYHSLKYDTGRALQQYGYQTPEQISRALAAVRAIFPQYNVGYSGSGDTIAVDGRPVDISRGFNTGRGVLQWGDWGQAPPAYTPPATTARPTGTGQVPGFQRPAVPGQPTPANLATNVLATLFPNGAPSGLLQVLLPLYQQWVTASAQQNAGQRTALEAQINALLNGNLSGAKTGTIVTGAKTGVT